MLVEQRKTAGKISRNPGNWAGEDEERRHEEPIKEDENKSSWVWGKFTRVRVTYNPAKRISSDLYWINSHSVPLRKC